jgi:hypothetical protein
MEGIPAAGLRRYFREQQEEMIEEEKKAALSRLHRRGLPKKAVKEEPLLVPHARINSFFSLKKIDAPNLPDDVPSILPELDAVVDQLPVEPVSIVTEKNTIDFIQYMLRRNRQYIEDSFQVCCAQLAFSLWLFNRTIFVFSYQTNYSQYCLRRMDERAFSLGALAVETHGV